MVCGNHVSPISSSLLCLRTYARSVLNCSDGACHVLLSETIGELCSLKGFHLLNHILIHILCVKFGLVTLFVILQTEKENRLIIKLVIIDDMATPDLPLPTNLTVLKRSSLLVLSLMQWPILSSLSSYFIRQI